MLFQHKLLVLQLGQLQHIGGQRGQLPRALHNQTAVFPPLRCRRILILHKRSIPLNGSDGRFELMGHIGDKIIAQGFDAVQLMDHLVEIGRHLPQRAYPVGFLLQPHLEVALGHLHGRFT
ncbi:hypothetical protein D3C76_1161200 [compost metagenome]